MLKALLDRVLELAEIKTYQVGDISYTKEKTLRRIKPPKHTRPDTLILNNLSGLVDYVERIDEEDLFFAVISPIEVSLSSTVNPDNDNIQFEYASAKLQVNNFKFGTWFDLETFIINMMSLFEQTKERDALIGMMANIANEHVVQNTDDKFSQTLQVKTGLTTKANEKIENPITLKPFRTFREIVQPESEFILRYQNRNGIEAALFEGDGGCWKLDAILRIKEWLSGKTEIPVIG